ncbi:hypothetical protein J8273_7784 [Carpediemonas membranifera]|uniref:TmcB/TmcC TPR repeats domain-containing protein n=1 Tax=Carpediemonas membranifera TaxID=201153 RepID=A0A8J6B0P5_9EUKA|nr:hypothetical protein J8273_7784 [Carpediemonas membranifera]|eukprot:KAG9390434.1 hypothetical protein J8273_7784 [Carpediemonas membranifera]
MARGLLGADMWATMPSDGRISSSRGDVPSMSLADENFGPSTNGALPWIALRLTIAVRGQAYHFPPLLYTVGRVCSLYFLISFVIQRDDLLRKYLGLAFRIPIADGTFCNADTSDALIWAFFCSYGIFSAALLVMLAFGASLTPNGSLAGRAVISVHHLVSTVLFIPTVLLFFRIHELGGPLSEVSIVIDNIFGWVFTVFALVIIVSVSTVIRLTFFNFTHSNSVEHMTQLPSFLHALVPLQQALFVIGMYTIDDASTLLSQTLCVTAVGVLPVLFGLLLFIFPLHAHPGTMSADIALIVSPGIAGIAHLFGAAFILFPVALVLYFASYGIILARYSLLTFKFGFLLRPDRKEPDSAQISVPPGVFVCRSLFFYAFTHSCITGLSMAKIRQKRDRLDFLSFHDENNADAARISEIHRLSHVLQAVTDNADTRLGPTLSSRISLAIYEQYVKGNTDSAIFEIFKAFEHVRGPLDALPCIYLYSLYQNAENSRRNQHTGFDSAMLRRLHVKLKTVQRQVMQAKLAINTFWSILARDKVDILELHRVSEQIYAHATSAERTFIWLLEYFPQRIPVIRMYADFLKNVALAPDAAEKLELYADYLTNRDDPDKTEVAVDFRLEFEHKRVLRSRKREHRSPLATGLERTLRLSLTVIGIAITSMLLFQLTHFFTETKLRAVHCAAWEYAGRLTEADFLLQTVTKASLWPDLPVHPFDSEDAPILDRISQVKADTKKSVQAMYDAIQFPVLTWLWPELASMAADHDLAAINPDSTFDRPEALFATSSAQSVSLLDLATYFDEILENIVAGETVENYIAHYAHFNIEHAQLPRLNYIVSFIDEAMHTLFIFDTAVSCVAITIIVAAAVIAYPFVFRRPSSAVKQAQERNLNLFMRMDKGIAAMMARSTDLHKSAGYIPTTGELVTNRDQDRPRRLSVASVASDARTATSVVSIAGYAAAEYSANSETEFCSESGSETSESETSESETAGFSKTLDVPTAQYPARDDRQDSATNRISSLTERFRGIRQRTFIMTYVLFALHLLALVLAAVIIVDTAVAPSIVLRDLYAHYDTNTEIHVTFDELLVSNHAKATAALGFAQSLDSAWATQFESIIREQRVIDTADFLVANGHDRSVSSVITEAYIGLFQLDRWAAISLYQSANVAGSSLPTSSQCFLSGMAYNYTAEPTHLLQALVYNSSRSRGYYSDAGADALLSSNDSLTVARNILVDPAYIEISDRTDADLTLARDTLLDTNWSDIDSLKSYAARLRNLSSACATAIIPLALVMLVLATAITLLNRRLANINSDIAEVQDWILSRPEAVKKACPISQRARNMTLVKIVCLFVVTLVIIVTCLHLILLQLNLFDRVWAHDVKCLDNAQYFYSNASLDVSTMKERVVAMRRYTQFADVTLGYKAMLVLEGWTSAVAGINSSIDVVSDLDYFDYSTFLEDAREALATATNASASIEHILRISFQLATEAAGLATSLPLPHYSYDASTEDDAAEDALHYPARAGHMYSSDTADGLLDADVQMEMARLLLFDDKLVDLVTEFDTAVRAIRATLNTALDETVFESDSEDWRRLIMSTLAAFLIASTLVLVAFSTRFLYPPRLTWAQTQRIKRSSETHKDLRVATILAVLLIGVLLVAATGSGIVDAVQAKNFETVSEIVTQLVSLFTVENGAIYMATSPNVARSASVAAESAVSLLQTASASVTQSERDFLLYSLVPETTFTQTCLNCTLVDPSMSFNDLLAMVAVAVGDMEPGSTCLTTDGVANPAFSVIRESEYPLSSMLWDKLDSVQVASNAIRSIGRTTSVVLLATALVSLPVIYRMLKRHVFAGIVAQEMLVKSLLAMVPEASLKRSYLLRLLHQQLVTMSNEDINAEYVE